MCKSEQLLNPGRQIDQSQRAITFVDRRNLEPDQRSQSHAIHIIHIGQIDQDRSALTNQRLDGLS